MNNIPDTNNFPLPLPSGQLLYYDRPEETVVCALDVFTLLNRLLRYGGAVEETVLQHLAVCVALAKLYFPNRTDIACYAAAHDLHEAYVGEWPRGLKIVLRAYQDDHPNPFDELEDAWEKHVHRSLGLPWPPLYSDVTEAVHKVDDRACALEAVLFTPLDWPHRAYLIERHGGLPTAAEMDACQTIGFRTADLKSRILRALHDGGARFPLSTTASSVHPRTAPGE